MLAYLDIMRPHNSVMAILAVAIGWMLITGFSPELVLAPNLLLAIAAVFLINGAGNVINDYLDLECDRINRPDRPLPSGKIGKRAALAYAVALFSLGVFCAGLINMVTFYIAIINTVMLVVYSLELQNKVFVGNAAVSYMVGSTFLFGGAATGSVDFIKLPLILMLLSFLATFAREVVKDLEDIEGDKKGFLKRATKGPSLAERFGVSGSEVTLNYNKGRAKIFAAAGLLAAVLISPAPFLMGIFGNAYLFALMPTDCVFLIAFYMTLRSSAKKDYSTISRDIKIGMLLALVSFLIGIIFKQVFV
jgi:geranylgeranylglycerol-phosphate geranylgeranyltransferase